MLALSLLLAACIGQSAGPCGEDALTLSATVTAETMEPGTLEVCRDQEVTLELAAETDGVFHIHGYDEHLPAISLTAGETTTVSFTADTAGQFIIELHQASDEESEIGVFTVHEQ